MLGQDLLLVDGLPLLLSLVGLAALIVLGEGLRVLGVSTGSTRRFVHAGVSVFLVVTPYIFSGPGPVYVLAGLFVVVNAVARWNDWWGGIHDARPDSWGTVALPLAVLPALAATWSVTDARVPIFQTAFLVLAVSDPLAAIMGQAVGRRRAISDATWWGSAVFFGSAVMVTAAVLPSGTEWSAPRVVGASIAVAAVATLVEAVSRRGWDNFFIVLTVVVLLVPLQAETVATPDLATGFGVGIVFGAVAWWSRSLDSAGAVAGGLFAASLVGLGGWAWAAPAFVFFILSSGLSRLPMDQDIMDVGSDVDASGRTIRQVLANGGIAWALLATWVIVPFDFAVVRGFCYFGFLGALSAAAADTWATEVGSRLADRPRSLRTFRPVSPGTSGAVSGIGSVAGLLGAGSVVGSAIVVPGAQEALRSLGATSALLAGIVGMMVDSVAGATVEGRYQEAEVQSAVGHPRAEGSPVRGFAWIDNGVVNVLGTSAGAATAMLIWSLLG